MTPTIVTVPNYVRPTYAYSQPYTAPGSIQPQVQAVGQPLAMPNNGHTGPVVTSAALPPQTIQMPAGTTIQYNTMPVSIKPSSTTQQRYIPTTTTTTAATSLPRSGAVAATTATALSALTTTVTPPLLSPGPPTLSPQISSSARNMSTPSLSPQVPVPSSRLHTNTSVIKQV